MKKKMNVKVMVAGLFLCGAAVLVSCDDDRNREIDRDGNENRNSTAGTTGNDEYYRNDRGGIDYNSTSITNSTRGEYERSTNGANEEFDSTTGSTSTTETTMSTKSTESTYNTRTTNGTSSTKSTNSTYNTQTTSNNGTTGTTGTTSTTNTTKNTATTGSTM